MYSILFLFSLIYLINQSYSDQQTFKHNNLFATKTTYHEAYHKLLNNSNQIRDHDLPKQCKPKMFYMICRHATRYPSKKKIIKMQETMYQLRDKIIENNKLDSDLIDKFKKWNLRMQLEDDNRITDTGFQETRQLANRIKNQYSIFFDLNKTNLKLYTTYKSRTNETAFAFYDEIFKSEKYNPTIKSHLSFHNECKKILNENGVKLDDPKPIDDLIKSNIVEKIRIKTADKIGINRDKFDFKSLKLIYIVCSFEYAIYNDTLWCDLLNKEDFQVLEYIIDLQSYLIGGHGRNINSRMACPILVDLIDHLNESINNKDSLITSLQFSHSGIFKRIYAMLGLFKDFGSSFCRSSLQCFNEWRSSLILPFLANIKFILYDCTIDKPDYRLMVKIQEHYVKIDGCDSLLCPLDDFMKRYLLEAKQCDLNDICRI